MKAKSAAAEKLQIVHCGVGLSIISATIRICDELLDVSHDLSYENKRLVLVTTKRRVFLIRQPIIDLILANDGVAASIVDFVVRHQKVSKETKWFFFVFFQRLGDLLPFVFEL